MEIDNLYQVYLDYPNVCTDTRKIQPGAIFFALKGPNFDANSFAGRAIDQGCSYAIIDDARYRENDKFLLVEDVLHTLQQLAQYHRLQLKNRLNPIPFIGITGSNGKTTTKELLNAVLSSRYNTVATQGNLNNHIGVPLTVLSVKNDTEIAIIEMGANHVGEIAGLCAIAKPDFGIITNIGKAHLEGFGSFEGVIKAKSELYEFLKENNGTVFLNNDNILLRELASDVRKITYGKTEESDITGKLVSSDPFIKIAWKKREKIWEEDVQTSITGYYNLENILAAICAGSYFKVEDSAIRNAIQNYLPSNNRSQVLKKGSNTIILDCYNANPVSMEAAIGNFTQLNGNGNSKIVILGDMLELGKYSLQEHERIIEILKGNSYTQVILVGKEFRKTALPENFKSFVQTEEAKKYLCSQNINDADILIKGSRGIKLETLMDAL